jgi:hypothetical protein
MNKRLSGTISRRKFLQRLAISGIAVTGGYLLYEYAPWLNYARRAKEIWKPLKQETAMSVKMRELVRMATLAASGHNAQPWQFATIAENAIEIHPDYRRRLPIVDPHDRELWMSLGCALENLLIAAHAAGYAPEVTYPDPTTDFIRVRLPADTAQTSPLLAAIPLRQNTRSEYNSQLVTSNALKQIEAVPLEPGVVLRFVLNPTELKTVVEYVDRGNLSQYADRAFVDELIHWLRFNQKEALASLDGLYSDCSGNPQVPRWLGKMFVAGTKPQQQADADAKKLRSSPGAVVIASESDDKTAWVRTGQVYERLALQMTAMDLKSAFLNQPIEVATIRGQFQQAIGLGNALPQLLIRFGYGRSMPQSLRRSVEQVIDTTMMSHSRLPHLS